VSVAIDAGDSSDADDRSMAELVCPWCWVSASQAERCPRCGATLVSRDQVAAIRVATAVAAGPTGAGAMTHPATGTPAPALPPPERSPPAPPSGHHAYPFTPGLEPSSMYPGMPMPAVPGGAFPAPWGAGLAAGHRDTAMSPAAGRLPSYPTPMMPGMGAGGLGMGAPAYAQMPWAIAAAEPAADVVAGGLAGLLAAGVGALLWAITGSITLHSYSLVAIGVGALVGCAAAWAAQGRGLQLGLVAAMLALLGCAAGDFLARVWIEANQLHQTFGFRLGLAVHDPAGYVSLSGVTLVFCAIAAYAAFRFASSGVRPGRRR
jgi:hypothetical protein